MRNNFFKFPRGTKVEFTLSRNRIFNNLVLTGEVGHYFTRPGCQTVRQHDKVKHYPVDLVRICTKNAEYTVDVDCVVTKPTQAMVDKVNERAEKAIMDKERPKKKPAEKAQETSRAPAFKLSAAIGKAFAQTYVASKNSKKFHNINSAAAKRITTENVIKFFTKEGAEASGRTYAGK